MTRRVGAIYFFFGLVVLGALTASYLHLAAWLQPWMPEGWEGFSYAAALALDGLILAPIVARQIIGAEVPGMALPAAQWTGLLASTYVNASWGVGAMSRSSRLDIGVGAALFPLIAWIAERAMHACVTASQAEEARRNVAAKAKAQEEEQAAKRRARGKRPAAPVAQDPWSHTVQITPEGDPPPIPKRVPREKAVALWRELESLYGDDPAEAAARTGRPLRTMQNWRQWAQEAA